MAAVTLQGVSKQFGTQVVLEDVSLDLHADETVGLVGANGAGKSTLFRLIAGQIAPDLGTVTRARGLQIGYLEQEPAVSLERTLHDEVLSVFAEVLELERKLHDLSARIGAASGPEQAALMTDYDRLTHVFEAAGGYAYEVRTREILGGLGFGPADLELPMGALSGGQKCRAALAKLLLQDRQLLLLDEPTNHLDIDAVRWLEKFLAGHHGGAVVVSHDRYLLDRLCQRILEVDRRRVRSYPGNYSNYAHVREIERKTQERQYEIDKEFIRKERDFIARHLAGQRTNEAKGRRTRLERRLEAGEFVTERPTERRTVRVAFQEQETRPGTVLRCDELGMSFGERALFRGLTFQVQAGQRLGITGPNGTGKSTLLRIVLGELTQTAGSHALDHARTVGYYEQAHHALQPERTVLEEIRAACPTLDEGRTRSLLARYLFRGDDVFKPLGALSGGEQSRVRLATLILQAPEVLILDEPTNHLDIPSREALEEALSEFAGTIIVVSHDRYFLDRVVQRLLVMRPTGCKLYEGNYSYYLEETERAAQAAKASEQSRAKSGRQRRDDSKAQRPTSKSSPYDRMPVDELEALVIEHESKLAQLHERFGDPAIMRDPQALEELQEEIEAATAALAEVDAAWQERAG